MDGYFRFVCPNRSCSKRFKATPDQAGQWLHCSCGQGMIVPSPKSTPPDETVPTPDGTTPARGTRTPNPHPLPTRTSRKGPQLLSLASAKAVAKDLAQKYKAPQTFRNFANLDPTLVANARATFAGTMSEAEVPLVFMHHTSRKDGTSGTLVTTRRVYCSLLPEPIELADVMLAHVERPSQLQELLAGTTHPTRTLLVNGVEIMCGTSRFHLLADFMTQLGKAFREEHGLAWKLDPLDDNDEDDRLLRLAAALVCVRRDQGEIAKVLVDAGMVEETAVQVVGSMSEIRNRPQKVLPWLLILCGPVLLFLALVSAANREASVYRRIAVVTFFGGLGLFLPALGLYRLLVGVTPWRTHELLEAWRSQAK